MSGRRLTGWAAVFSAGLLAGLASPGVVSAGDANLDGRDEVAVGLPLADVAGLDRAGALITMPGSAAGVDTGAAAYWDRATTGFPGDPVEVGRLGSFLAWGDYNGDGFDDLLVGDSQGGGIFGFSQTVTVMRGRASGLTTSGSTWLGVEVPSPFDAGALSTAVAGDFNGDGYDDAALGNPGYAANASATSAGSVLVLFGSSAGLSTVGSRVISSDSAAVAGTTEQGDQFGQALAAGDFDADGYDDLAVSAFHEDVGSIASAGAVTVLPGSVGGPTGTGSKQWYADVTGVPGISEASDSFGSALAAGDFDQDGHVDLAIGVAGESIGRVPIAGAVTVLPGADAGLTTDGARLFTADSASVPGLAEASDQLGWSLAAGDFDGNGYDDLAVGVPQEDTTVAQVGAVVVLRGDPAGLSASGSSQWLQSSLGVAGDSEAEDRFGTALAGADVDGDGYDDLLVGVPGKEVGTALGAGAVVVLHGAGAGISGTSSTQIDAGTAGVPTEPTADAAFGAILASGAPD